jgi:hypothetical protein
MNPFSSYTCAAYAEKRHTVSEPAWTLQTEHVILRRKILVDRKNHHGLYRPKCGY